MIFPFSPFYHSLSRPCSIPLGLEGMKNIKIFFGLSSQTLSPLPHLPFVHVCILNTTVPFNQVLVSATHSKCPSKTGFGLSLSRRNVVLTEDYFSCKLLKSLRRNLQQTDHPAERENNSLRRHSEMKTAASVSRCTAALTLAAFVCHLHSADYSSLLSCHNAPGAICNSNETFQTPSP